MAKIVLKLIGNWTYGSKNNLDWSVFVKKGRKMNKKWAKPGQKIERKYSNHVHTVYEQRTSIYNKKIVTIWTPKDYPFKIWLSFWIILKGITTFTFFITDAKPEFLWHLSTIAILCLFALAGKNQSFFCSFEPFCEDLLPFWYN